MSEDSTWWKVPPTEEEEAAFKEKEEQLKNHFDNLLGNIIQQEKEAKEKL